VDNSLIEEDADEDEDDEDDEDEDEDDEDIEDEDDVDNSLIEEEDEDADEDDENKDEEQDIGDQDDDVYNSLIEEQDADDDDEDSDDFDVASIEGKPAHPPAAKTKSWYLRRRAWTSKDYTRRRTMFGPPLVTGHFRRSVDGRRRYGIGTLRRQWGGLADEIQPQVPKKGPCPKKTHASKGGCYMLPPGAKQCIEAAAKAAASPCAKKGGAKKGCAKKAAAAAQLEQTEESAHDVDVEEYS